MLLSPGLQVAGQLWFQPGTIYTNDNKELEGEIDIRGLKREPYSIVFKASDEAEPVTFAPTEIKGFKVGSDQYVSAYIKMDTSPSSMEELLNYKYGPDGRFQKAYYEANRIAKEKLVPKGVVRFTEGDSVYTIVPVNKELYAFLKRLVTGSLNLYYFRDEVFKEHFYVSSMPGQYEELNRMFFAESVQSKSQTLWNYKVYGVVYEIEFFKPQLINYMSENKSLCHKVMKSEFDQRSLEDIVFEYNKSTGEGAERLTIQREKNKFNFGLSAGVGVGNIEFISLGDPLKYIDFDYKPVYSFGGAAELVFPTLERRFSLGTEATMFYSETNGSGSKPYYSYEADFEMLSVKFEPYLKARLLDGGTTPFIKGGLFYSFILLNNNSLSESYFDVTTTRDAIEPENSKKQEHGFFVAVGCQINKLNLEGKFEKGNGILKSYSTDSSTKNFVFAVTYFF